MAPFPPSLPPATCHCRISQRWRHMATLHSSRANLIWISNSSLRWHHLKRLLQLADTCQEAEPSWTATCPNLLSSEKVEFKPSSEVAPSASSALSSLPHGSVEPPWGGATCLSLLPPEKAEISNIQTPSGLSWWLTRVSVEPLWATWPHFLPWISNLCWGGAMTFFYYLFYSFYCVQNKGGPPWGGAILRTPCKKQSLNFKLQGSTLWGGAIGEIPAEKIKQSFWKFSNSPAEVSHPQNSHFIYFKNPKWHALRWRHMEGSD